MPDPALSESLEDYIETIGQLVSEHGHAHTKEIASRLGVRMPSVTNALWSLSRAGYIEYQPNRPVQLTALGEEQFRRVSRRHADFRRFFLDVLNLDASAADALACKMEHLVTEEVAWKFSVLSESLECRHDAGEFRTYLAEAFEVYRKFGRENCTTLSELPLGQAGEVLKIGGNIDDPQRLEALGITPGAGVVPLDGGAFRIDDTRDITLAVRESENVWVFLNH